MNSAIEFSVADFPGYAAAVARESALRGAACLGMSEVVCGLEVLPLCAAHVRLLSLVRSPFLVNGDCADLADKPDVLDDIMLFLWIVSPMYERGSKPSAPRSRWLPRPKPTARDRFNAAFAPILERPAVEVIKALMTYVDDAYIDADEQTGGDTRSYYAFEVAIAHELHTHYGYRVDFWNPDCPPDKNPLLVPLKLVFQLRKLRAQLEHGKDAAITNKSDKYVAAGLDRIGSLRAYERGLAAQPPPAWPPGLDLKYSDLN